MVCKVHDMQVCMNADRLLPTSGGGEFERYI